MKNRPAVSLVVTLALSCLMPPTLRGGPVGGGLRHTVVAKPDGTVWAWGSNSNCQLGDGTSTDRTVPTQITGVSNITAVAAGSLHTLALKSDGTVWAWGSNGYGQLGDGTTTQRCSPTVVSITGVIAIAAGDNFSAALTSAGRVWTWGLNNTGQLGDGTTTNQNAPLLLSTPTSVAAIGAGGSHALAVKSDGTVWSWGLNSNGQLGDASTTQRTSPVQMSGITTGSAVAGGTAFSLVLLTDGTLKATGNNGNGQLGDGTTTQRTAPVAVSSLTSVSAISGGQWSSYALKSDGTVWAWGYNGYGQLGDGTTTQRTSATQATTLSGIGLLGSGPQHGIAVSTTGVVWTWGQNTYSQLGDGTTVDRLTPIAISDASYAWKVATPVFSVAAGTYSTVKTVVVTCATSGADIHYTLNGATPTESDPTVSSGGSVTIDQTETLTARAWKTSVPSSNIASAAYTLAVAAPTFSPFPTTYTSAQTVTISTSSPGATIYYTTDGSTPTASSTVYTGSLSIAHTTTIKAIAMRSNWTSSSVSTGAYTMNFGTLSAPTFSPAPGGFTSQADVSLSAMSGATIRYTTDGGTVSASSPIYSSTLPITATTTVNAKAFHPDYVTSSQSAGTYTITVATPTFSPAAGTYSAGQVIAITTATSGATLRYTLNGATPTSTDPIVPSGGIVVGNFTVKVAAFKTGCTSSGVASATYQTTGTFTQPLVAGGDSHSMAVRGDGTFWSWGLNSTGQLGDGTTTQRALPVIVSGVTGVTVLSAGDVHSLAVTADGSAWAWGSNSNGQIGDGTTTQRNSPTAVASLSQVVDVAAGTAHSLAVKSDGTVWAWGQNNNSQLGDGTTTQRTSPVQDTALSGITGVAAGQTHSLAVKGDGTAWSWGNNGNGQLGTGNTTGRSTPGQVSGITTATKVASGAYFGLALLTDGTVKSWGHNGNGQLGDGSTTQRTSPVSVSSLTTVTAIAAGNTHALALKSDGTVWAWGYNGSGQIGDGTTTTRTSPVSVSGLPEIAFIAAGEYHSLAVGTDGTVWAWGKNTNGQLGDSTTTNRLSPVQIATAGMAWKVPTPVLSLAAGQYTTTQTVTVTESDATATLHYTTNGVTPTESDATVASGGTVAVNVSLTLKVRAFKPGSVTSEVASAAYELKAVAPTMSPAAGGYSSAQSVSIGSSTSGATIRYTTDGTEPSSASSLYSSAVSVSDTRTLKARAFKTGWTDSDVTASSYWIYSGTVATPTVSPSAGSYTSVLLVTLGCSTSGATIRYTVDGSDPTGASPIYAYPFLVDRSTTVKARAFLRNYFQSAVATAAFALDAAGQTAMPSITPGGGRFATAQTVSIAGPSGATLRYTTNGADPTDTDTLVPGGGTITVDGAQIVKVRAWVSGSTPSAVRRADFLVTGAIAAGHQHSLALMTDGSVWAWGNGSQLGHGTGLDSTVPVSAMSGAVAIAAGQDHSLALKNDGTVWAWGLNSYGQLGNGTVFNAFTPIQVSSLTGVIAIAAGSQHSLALKSDGTVWAWGHNDTGQIGDGTTTNRTSPVQVTGLAGVTSIAANDGFSLAVQRDGASGGYAWAWGKNTNGQLGDASTSTRTTPVRVNGITTASRVVAGRAFAMALLSDGTVQAWGLNDKGQLGTLGGGFSTAAVTVPVLAHVESLAAGLAHGLATDNAGRVWGWGDNYSGQLGAAYDTAGLGAPQLMAGITAAYDVSAGWLQTLVLRADGKVWGTGSSTTAGLGAGAHTALAEIPSFSVASNSWLLDDGDSDGLPSWREYLIGTDPLSATSNANGLSDLVNLNSTADPANPDSDGDGVPNIVELAQGTDPFTADTDGDTYSDLVDAFPLDATRHTAPTPDPNDHTAPTITLIKPIDARLVGGDEQASRARAQVPHFVSAALASGVTVR